MKLSAREAAGYFRRPDPDRAGLLIFGPDAMRVAARRQEVVAALIGPQGEAEMRLTRLHGADLRKDPALLMDAVKAHGFFPGPRVAFVEGATDAAAKPVEAALAGWSAGDAQMVVTAGQLSPRSALRKLFEAHRTALAIGVYDDPPGAEEVEAILHSAGLRNLDRDARAALMALSRELGAGDFRQTVEKLGLYMHNAAGAVSLGDVEACAPLSTEADLDDMLAAVAGAETDRIGGLLRRLYAQGVAPVTLCIGALRHFRILHRVASDPGGAGQGIGKLRPPVFGPRRDRLLRQAQRWDTARLESALGVLVETDLQLRSSSRAPAEALMERALIRVSILGKAR